MAERRKILVTSALPYANGPIHIGHPWGSQTDIWVKSKSCVATNAFIYVLTTPRHRHYDECSANRLYGRRMDCENL